VQEDAKSRMRQQWKAVGSYGTLGLEVVLSILVGLWIGQWLDGKLGTAPALSVVWFFFGLAAAGKSVWRTWKEMQAETAREEREQGNPAPLFEDVRAQEKRAAEDDRWAAAARSTDANDGARPHGEEHDER
jgi:ATP synthase protein I